MLFKPNNHQPVKHIVLIGLLTLLTSCANSAALESLVSPDPKLSKNKAQKTQVKPSQNTSVNSKDSLPSSDSEAKAQKVVTNNDNSIETRQNENLEPNTVEKLDLPANFPQSFPLYPQAKLKGIKSGKKSRNNRSGMLTWHSLDNQRAIADYYQAELTANDWTIIKPFTFNPQQKIARAIAVKDDLRVDLTLLRSLDENEAKDNVTQFSVLYQPIEEEIAESSIVQTINSAENSNQDTLKAKPKPSPDSQQQQRKTQPDKNNITSIKTDDSPADETEPFNSSGVDFQDLDTVPEQLLQPLELVAALDILTPYTGNGNVELSKFAPNQAITRGEYARWLVAANNRYFEDNPGKKIYIATNTDRPAFNDVKANNPDFIAIQSLAEAGLIPSRLTEDSTNLLFKPNAPLKREDLLTWKVPLDIRKALPQASIEAIKESWGFQDAADIESSATRALYADYQNGDLSNVRRIFGYTTLFQPKKTVTRAEAAASLWYFGFQGDGITAKEVLEVEADN